MPDPTGISTSSDITLGAVGTAVALFGAGFAWVWRLISSGNVRVEKSCKDEIARVDQKHSEQFHAMRTDIDSKHRENTTAIADTRHGMRNELQRCIDTVNQTLKEQTRTSNEQNVRMSEKIDRLLEETSVIRGSLASRGRLPGVQK